MVNDAEIEISKYFQDKSLDLRRDKFSRFMDQKVTPDVLSFIAECILNLPEEKKEFVVKDIWDLSYFIKNAMAVFNKPNPTNKAAKHEYDKFIQQPLRMLFYAGILDSRKERRINVYKILKKDFLEYISIKERNAYLFLYHYLINVLDNSGFLRYLKLFEERNNADGYKLLKKKFIDFIKGNTNINGNIEVCRIFPKVLNIYSAYNGIKGSEKGYISKNTYHFSDLMYNKVNFRDINKDKSLTRQESLIDEEPNENYSNYLIERAKNTIKRMYVESEIKDGYGVGNAIHVHHIFPSSEFPKLAYYLENLINLTADQHLNHAHPHGNTHSIDRDYQLVCLLAKSESIEKSINYGRGVYTLPNFIFVINTGLNVDISQNFSLKEIRVAINKIYNSS